MPLQLAPCPSWTLLNKKQEYENMSDKKRRYDHGRDVERGAEFSWVNTKCKALIVRVEKIDRAPYVEQPDERDGD
jgi:hypothetical protein